MTKDLRNADNVLNQTHFAYRTDHIPCTIQCNYTKFGKEEILTSRELKLLSGKTILGIGYDNQGNPVEMYTYDTKGKKVQLTAEKEEKANTLPNLIEERLNSLTKALAEKTTKSIIAPTVEKTNKPKKVKPTTRTIQPTREQRSV